MPRVPRNNSKLPAGSLQTEVALKRVQGMIDSMTAEEKRNPDVIDQSRRRRIAAGSGSSVQQVNQLLGQFKQVQKMMRQIGRGKMPQLPGLSAR